MVACSSRAIRLGARGPSPENGGKDILVGRIRRRAFLPFPPFLEQLSAGHERLVARHVILSPHVPSAHPRGMKRADRSTDLHRLTQIQMPMTPGGPSVNSWPEAPSSICVNLCQSVDRPLLLSGIFRASTPKDLCGSREGRRSFGVPQDDILLISATSFSQRRIANNV